MTDAEFRRFPEEAVAFLTALKANNDRDWFQSRKADFERALKRPAERFCAAMTARLGTLTGRAHGSKIYRLHRDLRFAKDRTPYNAHLHVSFSPEGAAGAPAWFFGLEPERVVWGAGVFAFERPALDGFRARLGGPDGATLLTILAKLEKSGARIGEPELKRGPAGYELAPEYDALLRRKGLCAWFDAPAAEASAADFMTRASSRLTRLKPLVDWLSAPPS